MLASRTRTLCHHLPRQHLTPNHSRCKSALCSSLVPPPALLEKSRLSCFMQPLPTSRLHPRPAGCMEFRIPDQYSPATSSSTSSAACHALVSSDTSSAAAFRIFFGDCRGFPFRWSRVSLRTDYLTTMTDNALFVPKQRKVTNQKVTPTHGTFNGGTPCMLNCQLRDFGRFAL